LKEGKVRAVGVSNFTVHELAELRRSSAVPVVSDQVEYNLFDRWVEGDILPYCVRERMTMLAYSPLDQGRLPAQAVLEDCAGRYGRGVSQIALNWLTRHERVVAIPKALSFRHIDENAAAAEFELDEADYQRIEAATRREPALLDPAAIRLEGAGLYRTLEEAKANARQFCPAPEILAEDVRATGVLKPVRVKATETAGQYVLTEGQVRYWAWVMAFGAQRPVPAYIRTN
jgi:hypothetical protein